VRAFLNKFPGNVDRQLANRKIHLERRRLREVRPFSGDESLLPKKRGKSGIRCRVDYRSIALSMFLTWVTNRTAYCYSRK
jgi:hypothetical protein